VAVQVVVVVVVVVVVADPVGRLVVWEKVVVGEVPVSPPPPKNLIMAASENTTIICELLDTVTSERSMDRQYSQKLPDITAAPIDVSYTLS
jgi:hypothetical protein